jgi:hypothetical protein
MALGKDGIVYVAARDGLYAISPEGKLAWKYSVLQGMSAPPSVGPDGVIYVTSFWGGFESVNSDGSKRWNSGYGMIGFDSAPSIGNEIVYLANTISDVWAFDPAHTPPLQWQIQTERSGMLSSAPTLPGSASVSQTRSKSSPVIGPLGTLYVPRQHWLHSVSTDGKPGWQLYLTGGMLGPAAVSQGGTIYVGDTGSSAPKFFAVNPDGSERWRLDLPAQIVGSPVVDARGNIYASTFQQLVAVSPDGNILWKFDAHSPCTSSPALTEDGTLYLGVESGELIAVDLDGKLKWSFKTRGAVNSPPSIGPDGTIYVTTSAGEVLALRDAGSPLMQNAWPRYQHDAQNTGRVPPL